MNPFGWLREKTRQLLQLKDRPHAIALGTAIGMFFGFIPLWGFKTLLALGVSRLLRANLLATAIAATLHDVALPLLPLLLRWEYDIGYWLLSHPHELPPSLHLSHHSPGSLVSLVNFPHCWPTTASRLINHRGTRWGSDLLHYPSLGRATGTSQSENVY